MPAENRKFYYVFPHIGFPKIFFSEGTKIYQKFMANDLNYEINRLWQIFGEPFEHDGKKDHLACQRIKYDNGGELLLITMPNPIAQLEAKYVGLYYKIEKKIFSTKVLPQRYFLLELGEPVEQREFFLCEWTKNEQHNNYGKFKKANADAFIDAIEVIVNGANGLSEFISNNSENEPKTSQSNITDTWKTLLDVAISDPDLSVRQKALEGVRELWPEGPKALDDLLFKMIEGLRDPESRNVSMVALTSMGELSIPMLKVYLKDPDPEMRKYITQVIIEIEKLKKELYS